MNADVTVANSVAIPCGLEVCDGNGRYFIVVCASRTGITIARSTWWRRLYWRVRGWFS